MTAMSKSDTRQEHEYLIGVVDFTETRHVCLTCRDACNPTEPRPFRDREAAEFHKQKMGLHDVREVTP